MSSSLSNHRKISADESTSHFRIGLHHTDARPLKKIRPS